MRSIADRASKLYDKMRLFVDDMSAIGQSLDKAQDNYRQAMKNLRRGVATFWRRRRPSGARRGNQTRINPDLAEQAVTQDEEYRLRSIPEGRQDEHYPNDERVKQQLS